MEIFDSCKLYWKRLLHTHRPQKRWIEKGFQNVIFYTYQHTVLASRLISHLLAHFLTTPQHFAHFFNLKHTFSYFLIHHQHLVHFLILLIHFHIVSHFLVLSHLLAHFLIHPQHLAHFLNLQHTFPYIFILSHTFSLFLVFLPFSTHSHTFHTVSHFLIIQHILSYFKQLF